MTTRSKKTKSDKAKPAPKRTTRRRAPKKKVEFPDRIFAIASPRSVGGMSLFDAGAVVTAGSVGMLMSDPNVVHTAVHRLQQAGFEVLQVNSMMINIAGSRETYEQAFNTKLESVERKTLKVGGKEDDATFFDTSDTDMPGLISTQGTTFEDILEGVGLEEPRYLMSASPFPPRKEYWHLNVPGDVAVACNAARAHRSGVRGRGIRIAMVDSGWYRHPFFEEHGYHAEPVILGPGTANPEHDEVGHGTGESANIFAIAPDATLLPVKAMLAGSRNEVLVNSTAAFNAAAELHPHIITNSWGFSVRRGPLSASMQALAASVAAAVASGITVVFSAGNGHIGFPGQHPDVISAGGVFMDEDRSLRASDYASGFESEIYANRRVPDLSGLVGMRPGAQYIMLPVEPGDQLDDVLAGGNHPNGDETADDDGWAAFSGTSAAAPQIAGAAALLLDACDRLSPADVRDILMRSARDVTEGENAQGEPAQVGPDLATGHGLVDVHRAVLIAKLRCIPTPVTPIDLPLQPVQPLFPLQPIQPFHPVQPVQPLFPLQPIQPFQPVNPVQPIFPLQPIQPIQPFQPVNPVQPIFPLQPIQPIQPFQPVNPVQPIFPLQPIQPVQPFQPVNPVQPIFPLQPIQPVQPFQPLQPLQPVQPFLPLHPLTPIRPLVPIQPVLPFGPEPGPGGRRLTEDDLKALEAMLLERRDD